MVDVEESRFNKLTRNIERYDRERLELRRDLGTLDQEIDDDEEANMGLADVENKIRTEVKRLREMKAERMKVFNDAREMEATLCESTGIAPCDIVVDRLPTDTQLRQVEKHIIHLRVR